MTDTTASSTATSPREVLRPLRQVRQYREFTDEPISDDALRAILDVARWTGSGNNSQPWRFIVLRDRDRVVLPCGVVVEERVDVVGCAAARPDEPLVRDGDLHAR